MKIILAQTAGFCMGVKRAMKIAVETAKENDNVFTCGPLIHNPQAVEQLLKNGISSVSDISKIDKGTLIIRAHGMPKNDIKSAKQKNIKIVDATCPHVLTSQKKIAEFSELEWFIAIIGDKNHPEILSLQSFAPNNHVVISNIDEAKSFSWPNKVMIIAQTTFSIPKYNEISSFIREKSSDVKICNSICKATFERQTEIRKLAKNADAIVVVGGKQSANTCRLAEIAKETCPTIFHIETADELNREQFSNINLVAVTAGASTPNFIMNEVIKKLKNFS